MKKNQQNIYVSIFLIVIVVATFLQPNLLADHHGSSVNVIVIEELDTEDKGIIVQFPGKVNRENAGQPENYSISRGDNADAVLIEKVMIARNARSAFLQANGLKSGDHVALQYSVKSALGEVESGKLVFDIEKFTIESLNAAGIGDFKPKPFIKKKFPSFAKKKEEVSIERGKELVNTFGCVACHAVDGNVEGKAGPAFKGVFGSVRKFSDGTSQVANKAYIRDSILNSSSKIVEGFNPNTVLMPSYKGLLEEVDLESLVLYIESLR